MAYLRRLPKFEYLAPRTVDDVCSMLSAHGGNARLLAGGTDLLLQMRRRETVPDYVIGLKGVAELAYVLRHVATIGGNIAGALPCADFPPALITLGAQAKLKSGDGERVLPIEELFPTFGKTVARPDELFTEIQIPGPPVPSGGTYLKFHDRHSMDMTTLGVSAVVSWDEENQVLRDVRIALASSAPVPIRARKAEAVLRGRGLAEDALEDAAHAVCEDAEPRGSWRATREFRFELLRALTKRAVRGAQERAATSMGENT